MFSFILNAVKEIVARQRRKVKLWNRKSSMKHPDI